MKPSKLSARVCVNQSIPDPDLTRDAGFKDSSALLKHELAYCLGQMNNQLALPSLERVLKDETEDPMVRHEVCTPSYQSEIQ